jgi:hypothetical protein
MPKTFAEFKHSLLNPGWTSGVHGVRADVAAAFGHVAWVVGWSLLIAAAIVLFWTLVRLVWPRS